MSGYIHRKPRKESPFIRYRFPYVQRWEYLEDNDLRPCHLREYFDDAMNYRVMGNPTPEGIQDEVATAPQELIELLYVPTFPLWYTVTTLCDPRELGIFAYFFRIVGGAVGILLLAFFPLIPFFIVGWFVCKIAVWYIPGWIQLLGTVTRGQYKNKKRCLFGMKRAYSWRLRTHARILCTLLGIKELPTTEVTFLGRHPHQPGAICRLRAYGHTTF